MKLGFYICDTLGFLRAMNLLRTVLTIVKYLIPLGLIVWIAIDLFKGVINPDNNKDGVKKIGIRFLAAVIVFLLPTIISGILGLFDNITGNSNYEASKCFSNATSACITKINDYMDCKEINNDEEKRACMNFRSCNSYKLDKDCNLTTELDDKNCTEVNTSSANRYSK